MEPKTKKHKKQSLETSFLNEVTGDNLKELTIEASEIVLDNFIEDGILKEIPFFGSLYKGGKALLGLRESIFAKKVFTFLIELKDIPQEKRQQFIDKLNTDDAYQNKVGEKLITAIDQLDDMGKPEIIGRLFKSAIEEKISYEDFLRLSAIVQKSFLPDLNKLKSNKTVSRIAEEQFVSIGIYSMSLKNNHRNPETSYISMNEMNQRQMSPPSVEYKINNLGNKLLMFGLR